MKAIVLVTLAMLAVVAARPEEKYTDKYDNVDIDQILRNKRLLVPYVDCALETRPCTADGKELKLHITDALQTGCSKCTDAQQRGSRKVINHLIKKEPQLWSQLKSKYDPQGKFTKKYEDELEAIKSQ